MEEKLLKLLAESFDLKKLANGIIDEVIEESLDNLVESTETELDDMAKTALWPLLERESKQLIEEKLDLAKILKVDEEEA